MERQQSALGGWTFALTAYYKQNITRYLDHPRLAKIMDLVDPYSESPVKSQKQDST